MRIRQGFTLIELLISLAVGAVLLASIYNFFISQQKVYAVREQVAEMQQNVRTAMTIMVRETRMAGYGVPQAPLSAWITWVSGVHTTLQITPGRDSAPDALTIVGSFESPIARLAADVAAGATSLPIQYTGDRRFDTQRKKIFYLGHHENGVITGIADSTLTIDTDPTTPGNQGLTRSYAAGAPLQLLKVIAYEIVDHTLKRNENTGAGRQPLAENIEDLQITQNGNVLTITLTGRTSTPDPDYTHPTRGDHYRRMTLSSQVRPRNLGL